MSQPKLSCYTLLLVFAAIVVTSAVRNEVFTGNTSVITWDGYGYYLYLPAVFVYGDITDYAFVEEHHANYEISSTSYQLMEAEDGAKFPIYNGGLAVVWAPAFLLTHTIVKLTGAAPADGLSFPYQLMVVMMSWLVIFLGLLALRRFLLHYFSDLTVAALLVSLGLGTNLFYYVVEAPDTTHAYLFAGYAIFLYQFQKLLEEERRGRYPLRRLIGLGLLAGLMCLTRSSEIVVFAIPAFYGLHNAKTFRHNFLRTLPILGVAVMVFSLQLLFYKFSTDAWFRDGYAGLGFDWANPHLYEGLLGFRRGWLIYTPLMAFALFGIAWLRGGWMLPVIVFTLGNCYLLFSWHIWWYGNTFGSRPVVQSYAVLALPLAAIIASALGERANWKGESHPQADHSAGDRRPRYGIGKVVTGIILLICIVLNLFQHWQYNERIIPLDFTNATYYRHIFGETTLNKKDRVYLDTNEKLPSREWSATTLASGDTLLNIPPKPKREFTNLLEYQAPDSTPQQETWLRTCLHFNYYGDTYDKWKFPSVITEHRRGEDALKWVQVKIPPTLDTPENDSLCFSISLPEWKEGDVVKQYLWNLSRDSMVVREYGVEILR